MSPRRTNWSAMVLFFLSVACGGCFTIRDFSALPAEIRAPEPTAIIPVLPAQARVTVGEPSTTRAFALSRSPVQDQAQVARMANAVFDTLCRNRVNCLLGPSKTHALLEPAEDWEYLHVYLDDPGPID